MGFFTPADLRHWRAQRGIKFPFKCLNLSVSLQAFLFFWYEEMDQTLFHVSQIQFVRYNLFNVSQIQFVLFTIEFCWFITIKGAFEQLYNIYLKGYEADKHKHFSMLERLENLYTKLWNFLLELYKTRKVSASPRTNGWEFVRGNSSWKFPYQLIFSSCDMK